MGKENSSEKVKLFKQILQILSVAICLLIIVMIVYRFFIIDPKSEITTGIIILIAFLIVFALSETFDNFSIGKIFTLSKTIEEKENEIIKIENEKYQLFNQVVNLSNNFNQKQSNTNILCPPDGWQQVSVVNAEDKEVEELKKAEEQEAEKEKTPISKKRLDYSKLKELALNKFLKDKNIDSSNVLSEMKLQAFQGIDPISDKSPVFCAYMNDFNKEEEVFFEVMRNYTMPSMFVDRLYLMLSKIYHYRTIKKTNSYLNLILIDLPENNRQFNHGKYIYDLFQPASNNKLLKISVIKFEENEITNLYKEA